MEASRELRCRAFNKERNWAPPFGSKTPHTLTMTSTRHKNMPAHYSLVELAALTNYEKKKHTHTHTNYAVTTGKFPNSRALRHLPGSINSSHHHTIVSPMRCGKQKKINVDKRVCRRGYKRYVECNEHCCCYVGHQTRALSIKPRVINTAHSSGTLSQERTRTISATSWHPHRTNDCQRHRMALLQLE